MDSRLDIIEEKVIAGERLTDDEALYLYESPHLSKIGELANYVNLKKNKGQVFYNINRHINPTNICVMDCKFCAFARKPGEEGAYAYSNEQILEKADAAVKQGATEVHMVGGLHPRWSLGYYLEMLREIKIRFPDLHIKGFTAVEIDWLAKKSRKKITDVLGLLHEAGLGSLPGGGAEIFHPTIREKITAKLSTNEWLNIHRTAHKMGLASNCTMLYGHIENYSHRVYHLHKLRELQDETNGFNAFIPLAFQPHNNEMGIDHYTSGFDDLKNLSVARLYLDNFDHIKSYWVMLGQDIAQLGLCFGANDLDGTVVQEKISKMAGGRSGMSMSQTSLQALVHKAGYTPVERDTLYRSLAPDMKLEVPSSPEANLVQDHSMSYEFGFEGPSIEEMHKLVEGCNLFTLAEKAFDIQYTLHGRNISYAPNHKVLFSSLPKNLKSLQNFFKLQFEGIQLEDDSMKSTLEIDLAGLGEHISENEAKECDFSRLLRMMHFIKTVKPNLTIILSGTKGIWSLAQSAGKSIDECFKILSAAKLDIFQSSSNESEQGLTKSEIISMHRSAHLRNLYSAAKVELNVPPDGPPIWEDFFLQLVKFRKLQNETGKLLGLSIEPAKDSFVSPKEYLQAVSLSRICVPKIPNIITNLLQIPILSPSEGSGSSNMHHREEKLATVLTNFGSNDLGNLPIDCINMDSFHKLIKISGFTPRLINAKYEILVEKDGLLDEFMIKDRELAHEMKVPN